MIDKKIVDALNAQINLEFWSSYLYHSMAIFFEAEGRHGIAHWFQIQHEEEQAHAQSFINYIHARGSRPLLQPIAGVPFKWEGPRAAFIAVLEHERTITSKINELYALAESLKDFATRQMLNAYIAEQVEEEERVQSIIDDLNLVGDSGVGLFEIDRELAQRQFVAPSLGY